MTKILKSLNDFYRIMAWPLSTFFTLTFFYNSEVESATSFYFFHFFVTVGIIITPLNHLILSSVVRKARVKILVLVPFFLILLFQTNQLTDHSKPLVWAFLVSAIIYIICVSFYIYLATVGIASRLLISLPLVFPGVVIGTYLVVGSSALFVSVVVLLTIIIVFSDLSSKKLYLMVIDRKIMVSLHEIKSVILAFVPVALFGLDRVVVSAVADSEFYTGYVYYSILALQPVSLFGALFSRRTVQQRKFLSMSDLVVILPLVVYVLLTLTYSLYLQSDAEFLPTFVCILLLGAVDRYWRLKLMYGEPNMRRYNNFLLMFIYFLYPAFIYVGFLCFGVLEIVVVCSALVSGFCIMGYYRAKW